MNLVVPRNREILRSQPNPGWGNLLRSGMHVGLPHPGRMRVKLPLEYDFEVNRSRKYVQTGKDQSIVGFVSTERVFRLYVLHVFRCYYRLF